MQGKVIKIFSDFYYVNLNDNLIECKLREVLKKSGLQILVGDEVLVEDYNAQSNQAAISELLPRRNCLMRPSVANVDKIILVICLKSPQTPFTNIDRYLAQAKYFGIDAIICVNKSDLTDEDERKSFSALYETLGYKVVYTSALNKTGIDELKSNLKGQTSLLCGPSGVGKTSLCNAIDENFVLRTGEVSKNTRGTHTTRHCEILSFSVENVSSNLVDTPGFSLLKFDYLEPKKVEDFFPEIQELAQSCKFSDCIHEQEIGCSVVENLDKISKTRYDSYLDILQEAKEYKKKLKERGTKIESKSKMINTRFVPKISAKKRDFSRRKSKQILSNDVE